MCKYMHVLSAAAIYKTPHSLLPPTHCSTLLWMMVDGPPSLSSCIPHPQPVELVEFALFYLQFIYILLYNFCIQPPEYIILLYPDATTTTTTITNEKGFSTAQIYYYSITVVGNIVKYNL